MNSNSITIRLEYTSLNAERLMNLLACATDPATIAENNTAISQAARAAMNDYRDNALEQALDKLAMREQEMESRGLEVDRCHHYDEKTGELVIITIDRGYGYPGYRQTHQGIVDAWQRKVDKANQAREKLILAIDYFERLPVPENFNTFMAALKKFLEAVESEVIHALDIYYREPLIHRDMVEAGADPQTIEWVTLGE